MNFVRREHVRQEHAWTRSKNNRILKWRREKAKFQTVQMLDHSFFTLLINIKCIATRVIFIRRKGNDKASEVLIASAQATHFILLTFPVFREGNKKTNPGREIERLTRFTNNTAIYKNTLGKEGGKNSRNSEQSLIHQSNNKVWILRRQEQRSLDTVQEPEFSTRIGF